VSKDKLNSNQESFCAEYIKNGNNATEAYRSVYGQKNSTDKSLNERASRLLSTSKIQARIKGLQEKVNTKVEKKLGLEVVDVALMFKEMYYKAEKDADKLKAAENLMKHLGGYQKDNEQSKTTIDIPNINFNGNKSK